MCPAIVTAASPLSTQISTASARPGAGRVQYVEARAVAVIDLEAEGRRRLDHLDVVVDDRDVDAAQQQRLADDLAEAAEADDQHAAAEAVGEIDAVERLLLLRRRAV